MKNTSVVLHALAAAAGILLFARPLSLDFTASTTLQTPTPPPLERGLSFGPDYPVTLPAGPNTCSASIPLGIAQMTATLDFSLAPCGSATLSVLSLQVLNPDSSWRSIPTQMGGNALRDIGPGTYQLLVEVSDTCNGTYQDAVKFQVTDEEAPTVSCVRSITATLYPFPWPPFDKYPIDRVYASRVNQSSFDACGPLAWVKVRRLVSAEHFENLIFYGYDSNGDGIISTEDGVDGDYNGVLDPEEFFTPGPNGMLYTPAMPYVDFFCPDLIQKPIIELVVKDQSGNISTCSREVQVNDAGWLRLTGPADMEIECSATETGLLIAADTFGTEAYIQAAAIFGDLRILGGNECSQPEISYEVDASGLSCGSGTIIRRWTVGKPSPIGFLQQQVTQTILVRPTTNFDIFFPGDMQLESCGAESLPIPQTTVKSRSCDTLKVEVADWITPFTPRSCDVLYRTFTVSNPCAQTDACARIITLDRNLPAIKNALNEKGFFVLIRDMDQDGIQEVYISLDSIPDENERAAILPSCADGRFFGFRFTQVINLGDGQAPTIPAVPSYTYPARWTDCRGDAVVGFRGRDNCFDPLNLVSVRVGFANNPTASGNPSWYARSGWTNERIGRDSFVVRLNNLAIGEYLLHVVLQDACGNQSQVTMIPFSIQDQTAPTPFCQAIRTVNLNANGQASMPFWELLAGQTFDCSGQIRTTLDPGNPARTLVSEFSVNRKGETPNRFNKIMYFDCSDAGKLIDVELHAWDQAGNNHFCQAKVQVQASGLACAQDPNSIGAGGLPQWNLSEAEKAYLKVSANFPNPFIESTTFKFYLPADDRVILTVHDIQGRALYRQEAEFARGEYMITLPGENLSSGVLIATLEAPGLGQRQVFRLQKVQ